MALRAVTVDGCSWQVWEVHPGQSGYSLDLSMVAPRNREGWLCFRCAEEKRRISPIPGGWATMTEAELGNLTRRAVVVSESKRG